jgi:hypothetical protein
MQPTQLRARAFTTALGTLTLAALLSCGSGGSGGGGGSRITLRNVSYDPTR